MKTVVEMAREAGWMHDHDSETGFVAEAAIKFAALVRADERNSWPAEMEAMERQVNILTDALAQAKADEREACAEVCESWLGRYPAIEIMNAIRARSNP